MNIFEEQDLIPSHVLEGGKTLFPNLNEHCIDGYFRCYFAISVLYC